MSGTYRKVAYVYRCEGTCNVLELFPPSKGWRQMTVMTQRMRRDFAACMPELGDEHFPDVTIIRVVQDT